MLRFKRMIPQSKAILLLTLFENPETGDIKHIIPVPEDKDRLEEIRRSWNHYPETHIRGMLPFIVEAEFNVKVRDHRDKSITLINEDSKLRVSLTCIEFVDWISKGLIPAENYWNSNESYTIKGEFEISAEGRELRLQKRT